MICPKCDRDLPDDAVLCCYCGRTIIRKAPARTHQRPNGSGSAYKRGKTWTARVTAGWRVDENDVKHQRWKTKGGFKTKAEALAYCDKLNRTDYKNAKKAPKLSENWDIYEEKLINVIGEHALQEMNKRNDNVKNMMTQRRELLTRLNSAVMAM